jgi:hypothetical protein
MGSSGCALVFLCLLLASMIMQFRRAKMRKRIVRQVNSDLFTIHDQLKWAAVDESFDFLFKDFRKLQIAKRNLGNLPSDFCSDLKRYSNLSRAEIAVTITMLLFAGFAYRICQ